MSFNFKEATLEQMIEHVRTAPCTIVSRAKKYHKDLGNVDVVKMISAARKEVAMEKLSKYDE
jgi:hypothetical protein